MTESKQDQETVELVRYHNYRPSNKDLMKLLLRRDFCESICGACMHCRKCYEIKIKAAATITGIEEIKDEN